MNEKLRFTYGHILAILSLLFITYISFLGLYYLTNGNHFIAIGGAIGISFLLFFFYSRVQVIKSAKENFDMARKVEIVFLVLFIITACGSFVSFSHFWAVQKNESAIVDSFRESLDETAQIFVDYEEYATVRIEAYRSDLMRVERSQNINPSQYKSFGLDKYKTDELVEQLEMQLLPEISYYENFKAPRIAWINKADKGATVWNPFLLSNIKKIESAANSWIEDLNKMSSKVPENEHTDFNGPFVKSLSFDELTRYYTTMTKPSLMGIVVGIACYLLLLMPYFLQQRHTKVRIAKDHEKRMKNSNQTSKQSDGSFTLD